LAEGVRLDANRLYRRRSASSSGNRTTKIHAATSQAGQPIAFLLSGGNTADLRGGEPPPYNRRFLESRLAYRIQELAYGGLKPETLARLEALGEQFDGGKVSVRRMRGDDRPIAGTQLIREYRGVEHVATVTRAGYDYQGRSYQSLSAIARSITGTRWNGRVFFGLRSSRSAV
jgi:hypothetical protein